MRVNPANSYQRAGSEKSVATLQDALILAKIAGCPKLCRAIRKAISSGKGAVRHMSARRREYARLHQLRPAYLIDLKITPEMSAAYFRATNARIVRESLLPIPANYRFPYAENSFK